ncbi:MAG: hypothetical protein ACREKE_11050, partial [bacterium]
CLVGGVLPRDRAESEALLSCLTPVGGALHAAGLKLNLVARVRTGALADSAAFGSLDLASVAACCDGVQVLGFGPGNYDPTMPTGPEPLAPLPWCGTVIDQALAWLKPEQLEWTLPGLGYAWGMKGAAPEEIPYSRWQALVRAHPPEHRDPASGELFLRRDGTEVWVNDAISLTSKLWEARQRGLSSAALWGLGSEDPRLWALLDSLPAVF